MKVTAIVTGDADCNRRLNELAGPDQKKAVRKACRAGLRPVLAEAKATAPRRTGKLRQNIKLRAMKRSRVRIAASVTASDKKDRDAFYGGQQEYGWRAGRRVRNSDLGLAKGAKRTPMMAAIAKNRNNARRQIPGNHFMKKAGDKKESEALTIYRGEMIAFIDTKVEQK